MNEVFGVFFRSAESYNSKAEFPVAVYSNKESAILFAEAQDGYGFGIDWFVKPIKFNPPFEKVRR